MGCVWTCFWTKSVHRGVIETPASPADLTLRLPVCLEGTNVNHYTIDVLLDVLGLFSNIYSATISACAPHRHVAFRVVSPAPCCMHTIKSKHLELTRTLAIMHTDIYICVQFRVLNEFFLHRIDQPTTI